MHKLVGITCSSTAGNPDPEHFESARQYLNSTYVRAVQAAGGVPVILPNVADEDLLDRYLGSLDGLLLSGGVDVDPARYSAAAHPDLGEVDSARDSTELPLIRRAIANDMPIFGICRGIQMLNVALGGTLFQHLPADRPSPIHHRQTDIGIPRNGFAHTVAIQEDCRLRSIVDRPQMQTNSFHHQALNTVASSLVVTAHAEDGVIEAVEAPGARYMVAVQFHPEETAPFDESSRRLFEAFIHAL